MTADEWRGCCYLMENAWKGEMDEEKRNAYRVMLDGYEADEIVRALRRIMHNGHPWLPYPPEIVAALDADDTTPTFEEAYLLMFGPRGVVLGRTPLAAVHPLVRAFVERQDVERLRRLPLDDPDFGELRRKELREAWGRHAEAFRNREVAAMAAGQGRAGLHKFDPLAVLSAPTVGELPA